jgi:glycerol-3-phosphate dehydrogenase
MGYTPHVLVIGGGVIGTGIARDFAIRGLDVTLAERSTLTAGATGQTLGELHSGARTESGKLARRVSRENQILREIADHCIERSDGLLVSDADEKSFEELVSRVESRSITHEVLEGDDLRDAEPAFAEDVDRALRVPDAAVDQFSLTIANARSASEYGAEIRTHTAVTDITVDDGTIKTVTIEHRPPGAPEGEAGKAKTDGGVPGTAAGAGLSESDDGGKTMPGETGRQPKQVEPTTTEELDPDYVVNATGGWADQVAGLAGLDTGMRLTAETTVLLQDCPVETLVSRYAPNSYEETIVPQGVNSILGTEREDVSGPAEATPADTDRLRERLSEVVSAVGNARILRTNTGIRAWHPEMESVHEHALIDHGNRDGCWGMTTVVGGSLSTHRYVAKHVADEVCAKFGIRRDCQTDEIPLPSTDGQQDGQGTVDDSAGGAVVCECQSVTRAEVRNAIADEMGTDTDLNDVRIRTGAMMGECQGGLCAHRVGTELYPEYDESTVAQSVDSFLDGHWEGQRGALRDSQLERAMRSYILQVETLNLPVQDLSFVSSKTDDVEEALDDEDRTVSENTVSLAAFDDGRRETARERPTGGERQQ